MEAEKKKVSAVDVILQDMRERIFLNDFDTSRPITEAEISELYDTSRSNIRIVLQTLESEGLVRTERTSGRYVTEDTNLIEQLRVAAAHDIAADFLEKMRSIGYTPEKAAALLEHWDTEEVEPHE